MTQAEQPAAPLGLIEKGRVLAAVGAAVLLLYAMGWMVAQPANPELAATFVRSGRAVAAIWPTLAVLTVVAAVIGTVVAGPRLPEAGLFAAAIGVAALSLRGGSMQVMLSNEGAITEPARQAFMMALVMDVLLWSAIMLAAWIAVSWAYKWIWLNENLPALLGGPGSEAVLGKAPERVPAGAPGKPPKTSPAVQAWAGWTALVVTGVVGIFIIWVTAGRTPVSNVHRGQTIAAVAGGLYLGAMAARYFTGVTDVRWYLLAVPAIGVAAYLVGHAAADMGWAQGTRWQYYIYLATTPVHDLARPLPVEYVAVGTAAALAGYWGGDKVEQVAQETTG